MAAPRPKACSILPDTTLGDDVALVAENMEAILSSPSYSLAQDDRELLDRTEMRGVRMLLELGKPELAFLEDNITSTVIVFGGTQIVERAAAERRLSEARRALARAQTVAAVPASAMAVAAVPASAMAAAAVPASAMAAAAVPASAMESAARELKRAEQLLSHCHYYDEAREFARLVSIDNQCDDKRDYVVITGGGPGIMEAANRGAFDVGCKSIGLNIKLPSEQQPNPFITPELCFQFKYFALRKFHFILRACCFQGALARSTRCSRRSPCGRRTACNRCRSSSSAATTGQR
jgi:predicted Rossmann-fold nucleotide-binding protein